MSRITHDLCDWLRIPHHAENGRPVEAPDRITVPKTESIAKEPERVRLQAPAIPAGRKRLLLAGGSGYLGRLLRGHFEQCGWEVLTLTRSAGQAGHGNLTWDGRALGEWATALDGANVLINLAGRSVNCRYHARNRRAMLESRIESTRVLGEAVARFRPSPPIPTACAGVV